MSWSGRSEMNQSLAVCEPFVVTVEGVYGVDVRRRVDGKTKQTRRIHPALSMPR